MFALEVELLMGTISASRYYSRRDVEWPPHPSRLFSALVAACEECDMGESARNALRWLEMQDAPAIYADPPGAAGLERDVRDVFVPVNDARALGVLPARRSRQLRWFPAFAPADPKICFIWPTDAPEEVRQLLARIAAEVTYLGHSMSPVRATVVASEGAVTLIPDERGEHLLRAPGKGRLDHLRTIYEQRLVNAAIQPRLGRLTPYAESRPNGEPLPSSLFHHPLVFRRIRGPSVGLEATAAFAEQVRKAVMDLFPNPLPEWLSGHAADGRPASDPHMAVVPMADTGHRFADGHLLGFALWLPCSVQDDEIERLEDAVYDLRRLSLGRWGSWDIEQLNPLTAPRVPVALRTRTYTARCGTWASVTPVVFDRFPKKRPGKDATALLGVACERIGLPRPIDVRWGPVSMVPGNPPRAGEFFRPKQAENRLMAHVFLEFEEPIRGPVLLGAGRFLGLGLFRPLRSSDQHGH